MSNDAIIIRNYELLKRIFDELDVLNTYYKLNQRDIGIVQLLCMKHCSYNAYIQVKTSEFKESRRVIYRSLDKLENENILTVISRPRNQHEFLEVYFTVAFIKRVCGEDFAQLYENWLNWQKEFKLKGEEDDN